MLGLIMNPQYMKSQCTLLVNLGCIFQVWTEGRELMIELGHILDGDMPETDDENQHDEL